MFPLYAGRCKRVELFLAMIHVMEFYLDDQLTSGYSAKPFLHALNSFKYTPSFDPDDHLKIHRPVLAVLATSLPCFAPPNRPLHP